MTVPEPTRARAGHDVPAAARAAISGIVALGAAMALAELTAVITGPTTVPVVAVGTAIIPLTPEPVKERAIALFGTSDKTALIIGTCIALVILAAIAGLVGRRRPTLGGVIVLLLGGAGALAAGSRVDAGQLDVVPSLVAALVGILVLQFLLRRVRDRDAAPAAAGRGSPQRAGAAPRRSFLAAAGSVTAAALAVGAVGEKLVQAVSNKAAARASIVLPRPHSLATAQPPGVQVSKIPEPRAVSVAPSTPAPRATPSAPAPASTAPSARASTVPSGTPGPVVTRPASPPSRPSPVSSTTNATAASQPAAAMVDVEGVSDFFIASDDFYRIDTSLVVPELVAANWGLRIHGMVGREIRLTYAELLKLPLYERDITLSCVSNDVGGSLVGNARWLGALLAPLLRTAGVGAGAEQLVSTDSHGMSIGTPVAAVMDGRDAMLAVGMNGQPLPFAHGFPVRMVVPGLYGYVSACKWIVDIEVTTWNAYDAYWVQRGWAQQGPIRTESRIDTPRGSAQSGIVPVAGVAWAPHVGIRKVEIRIDDDDWVEADLAPVATDDTWREWVYPWIAAPGNHRIQVRATDKSGYTQTAAAAEPFPSGATGWHTITVHVG